MATAQTIINRAARLLGKISPNSDLRADESADALVALNAMLDGMRNEVGLCYAFQDESFALTGGVTSYSIGPSGDFVTTRPISIEDAYLVNGGVSYGLRIIPDAEYDGIPLKTATANWPDRMNYRPTMPNGTLYVYPVSDGTAATLHLRTQVVLTAFALTDTVSLPPGWEDMLAPNLALALAPEYETVPNPMVIKMATGTLAAIKRANQRPRVAYTDLPALIGTRRSNIITNQP